MSSSDIALSVRGLSKSYRIARGSRQPSTLAEAFVNRLKTPLQKVTRETFWALQDVDFDIYQGDVVGIMGRNGAGKSTLLKILSRITEPTKGQVDLYGRVGSLLEVGTGFHPELTGRENIFLNGSILGMRKAEVTRQFDAIVDFAGVAQFLETPVKRYSSGMYVRLAFAVAAHLSPEILIVDEVLAVGDSEFQKKCLGKMQDVATQGRTVLFVSHNLQAVSLLCNKGIFLRAGQLKYTGTTMEAIEKYIESFSEDAALESDASKRRGSGHYRITSIQPDKKVYGGAEPKTINFRIERKKRNAGRMYIQFYIVNSYGAVVTLCDTRFVNGWFADNEVIEGYFTLRTPWLKAGDYRVDAHLQIQGEVLDRYDNACLLSISEVLPYAYAAGSSAVEHGLVFSDFDCAVNENQQS